MRMESHLGRARNLGASRNGVGPWWVMRLTSIALVPLSLWMVFSIFNLIGQDYDAYVAWLGNIGNITFLSLFVVIMFHHSQQGLCEVIHDYVHDKTALYTSMIIVKFLSTALALACLISIFKVAFGG